MAMTQDEAVQRARGDLASRLSIADGDISEASVDEVEFPDAAFGAAEAGEMSAQMLTPGWRIRLRAGGQVYEYRANRNRMRLVNFKGANHRV